MICIADATKASSPMLAATGAKTDSDRKAKKNKKKQAKRGGSCSASPTQKAVSPTQKAAAAPPNVKSTSDAVFAKLMAMVPIHLQDEAGSVSVDVRKVASLRPRPSPRLAPSQQLLAVRQPPRQTAGAQTLLHKIKKMSADNSSRRRLLPSAAEHKASLLGVPDSAFENKHADATVQPSAQQQPLQAFASAADTATGTTMAATATALSSALPGSKVMKPYGRSRRRSLVAAMALHKMKIQTHHSIAANNNDAAREVISATAETAPAKTKAKDEARYGGEDWEHKRTRVAASASYKEAVSSWDVGGTGAVTLPPPPPMTSLRTTRKIRIAKRNTRTGSTRGRVLLRHLRTQTRCLHGQIGKRRWRRQ